MRRIADWTENLHDYLLRAMFDNCAGCGIEDGYGHADGCKFAPPPKIYKGRVTKVSKRPPMILEDD